LGKNASLSSGSETVSEVAFEWLAGVVA